MTKGLSASEQPRLPPRLAVLCRNQCPWPCLPGLSGTLLQLPVTWALLSTSGRPGSQTALVSFSEEPEGIRELFLLCGPSLSMWAISLFIFEAFSARPRG